MSTREKGHVICVENRGAADLEGRKVYRVLRDNDAAASGYMRVIDESGEDSLYPAHYFVALELPQKAKRAWTASRGRQAAELVGQAASAAMEGKTRMRSFAF